MSTQPHGDRPDGQEERRSDEGVELPRTRARQGVTFGHMRWVLRISLVLAALGLLAAWLLL